MALSATCRVYIAFSAGPLVASPTWTEVTSYVRSVRTSRGRSNELDDFGAGTCTVVLDNRDRRFDPDYASGPYFGNLLPRRQIKVEGFHSGGIYPIYRGLVQSWVQDYPAVGRDARTTVQATDLFGLLATWDLPETAHELAVRALTPLSWWQLDDEDNIARDSLGGNHGYYSGSRTKVDAIGAAPGASRVDTTPDTITGPEIGNAPAVVTGTANTVTVLMRGQATNVTFADLRGRSRMSVRSTGQETTAQFIDFTGVVITAAGNQVVDGEAHHVAAVRSGTTVKLFIDGVEISSDTDAGATSTLDSTGIKFGKTFESVFNDVTMSQVAVWDSALAAADIAILADAALTGWAKQRVEERMTRVLDLLGVPSALRSLPASSSSVGPFEGGTDALSYIQALARSDQGRVFVSRSGVITFHPKTTDMGAASYITFADDSTASAVRYKGFELELDDRLIYNEVTVAGTGEATFTARNTTSITTYSRRGLARDTELPSSAACQDVAEKFVSRYAAPATRGRSWTVAPERTLVGSTTRAYTQVLAAELGDVVTVKRTPPLGSAVSKTVQITSIVHEIDIPGGRWDVNFAGAPVDTASSFRWGTSNWGGTQGWS